MNFLAELRLPWAGLGEKSKGWTGFEEVTWQVKSKE